MSGDFVVLTGGLRRDPGRDRDRNADNGRGGEQGDGGLCCSRRQDEFEQGGRVADLGLQWTEGTVAATNEERSTLDHERSNCGREQSTAPAGDGRSPDVAECSEVDDGNQNVKRAKRLGLATQRRAIAQRRSHPTIVPRSNARHRVARSRRASAVLGRSVHDVVDQLGHAVRVALGVPESQRTLVTVSTGEPALARAQPDWEHEQVVPVDQVGAGEPQVASRTKPTTTPADPD